MSRDLSFEAAIRFAADLIRIPSPPGDEAAVAARVAEEMDRLGFDEVRTDAVGNVIGRIAGRSGGPGVMLSSHLDVVDAGDPETWEHPPYGGVVADGFLHGRGAMDIKGPLALQTYAAAHFVDDRLDDDVWVAHTVLEERNGWGMAHLMDEGAVRPAAAIIGESTGGDICIGHRGRAELAVVVHGVAGHASAPERAKNALDLVPAVLDGLRAFAATLPSHPVLGRSTLVATGVETTPASPNVIPDYAGVTVDWRILPGVTADDAVRQLRDFLHERVDVPEGYGLDVRPVVQRQRTYTGREDDRTLFGAGFLVEPDHPVVRAAARAVERTTGDAPEVRPWTFATDGRYTAGEHDIPTIGYAPGEERHAHTNRERLSLDAAETAYRAYPAVIRAVQGAVG